MKTHTIAVLIIASFCARASDGVLLVEFDASEYSLLESSEGVRIEMDGFSPFTAPGEPRLLRRNFAVLLPPGARAVSAEVLSTHSEELPGEYLLESSGGVYVIPGLEESDIDRRNIALAHERVQTMERSSTSRNVFPEGIAWLSAAGTLRKYSYAQVSFCPFSYIAASGQLTLHSSVQVAVHYRLPEPGSREAGQTESLMGDTAADERAGEMFFNFAEGCSDYLPQAPASEDVFDYLIVTTDELLSAVESTSFIAWKTETGFSVKTITVSDPLITSQQGESQAEQIRNFLREYYGVWGIEYVLFVGDYESVPMQICYPDPDFHVYDPSNPGLVAPGTPTDAYYADLSFPDSESWDLDGDGFPGEFGQDMPDFLCELSVGRIPVNNPMWIMDVLARTVAFEQDSGSWKNNVLNAGTILFFENQDYGGYPLVDGAVLLDSMETGLMTGMNITHMSEQWGLQKSLLPWPAISEGIFSNHWRTGEYSVVNWSGHGWPDGAARSVWSWDDGDGVPETSNGEINSLYFINVLSTVLENDHPSVVFAISCDVGYPEPNMWGNCGIDMLASPEWGTSIGVVSASRPAAVSGDWKNSPGGTEQICYEFNRYLFQEADRTGDALYNGKYHANSVYGWEMVYEYMNLYNFNLYGDPSLELSGAQTGVEEQEEGENSAGLLVTGPNPFSAGTVFQVTVPCDGNLTMSVFDLSGRKVATLVDDFAAAGVHNVEWNGFSGEGEALGTGTYFAVTETNGIRLSAKTVILR